MVPRSLSRRLLAPLMVVVLAACGSSAGEQAASTSAPAPAPTEAAPAGSDAPTGSDAGSPSTTEVAPGSSDAPAIETAPPLPTAPDAVPKPEVKIPTALPTELVITDLTPGSGPEAKAGDTVVVHYVGVRSEDGTEFDNSFDRGSPFPVALGTGGVIAGWDEGLLGAQAGMRRQLDIPADLAYGDSPQGEIIKAGDALTFVIDVLAVVSAPDPASAPGETVEPATAAVTEIASEDLIPGEGAAAELGQTASVHIATYLASTGAQLDSSWTSGAPVSIPVDPNQVIASVANGIVGMKPGGRRQLTIPAAEAFGADGNPGMGVPADADIIVIIDLFGAY